MDDRELRRVFDQVRLSPERQAAMLERLLEEEQKPAPARRVKKLTILWVAAALLLLAACVTTVTTGMDVRWMKYFGLEPEEEWLLSDAWVTVGESHTYENGWTLEVVQALADCYSSAILVDITAPEGTNLSGEHLYLDYVFEPDPVLLEAGAIRGWTPAFHVLEDGEPEDNHLSVLLFHYPVLNSAGYLGTRGRFTPVAFRQTKDGVSTRTEFAQEEWSVEWTFSDQDAGLTYALEEPIMLSGSLGGENLAAVLTEVYLSPIYLNLKYTREEAEWSRETPVNASYIDEQAVVLHTRAGEDIAMGELCAADGVVDIEMDETTQHFGFSLAQIVQPADIVSITIWGQTIQLDGLEPVTG